MTEVATQSKTSIVADTGRKGARNGWMRALVAGGNTAELRSIAVPRLSQNEVLIDVRAVGLCRTDLYVVSGEVAAKNAVIPGHEFSGIVATTGSDVTKVRVGERVAVNPLIPCGRCDECQQGCVGDCHNTEFLGVDRDGALADFVAVPESTVVAIPADMSWLIAAFAEPVAATLAVLKADIQPEQRGLVFGDNRISKLTLRILRLADFSEVTICSAEEADNLPENHFDFIVETMATTETMARMVRLLRPRGRIVLKSRQHHPVSLVLRDVLPKEPVFEAVHYGRFDEAVELLASRKLQVDDLIGNCYPLDEHERAFAAARAGEKQKTFLIPRED